jgi:hypothetical protein
MQFSGSVKAEEIPEKLNNEFSRRRVVHRVSWSVRSVQHGINYAQL